MAAKKTNKTFVPKLYITKTPLDNESSMLRMQRFKEIAFVSERPFMTMDLLRFCFGNKIGEGAYRAVYDFDFKKGTVIKVATDERANIIEWNIWQACKSVPAYRKWLAPCIDISPCGHYLIQKKIKPVRPSDKLPKQLPTFFDDIKRNNWGWLAGKLVCHDYQFLERIIDISFNAGNRKAEW